MLMKRIVWMLSLMMLSLVVPTALADNNNFFNRSVYVDVNVGYAAINWSTFDGLNEFTLPGNSGRGGFSVGADTGYQYDRYFGFELGWYYLSQAKYRTLNNVNFTVRSWLAYFGPKISIPIYQRFSLFAKVAVSYRYLKYISSPGGVPPAGRHSLWRPAAAVGWQAFMTPNWSILMQYMYVPGQRSGNQGSVVAPPINLIMIAYAYKFEV